jgi:hypothetical protein
MTRLTGRVRTRIFHFMQQHLYVYVMKPTRSRDEHGGDHSLLFDWTLGRYFEVRQWKQVRRRLGEWADPR